MSELHFVTDNAEETAYALIELSQGDALCGELEDHGGVLGQITDGIGGPLSWYLALTDRSSATGQALLTIMWDDDKTPSPGLMKRVFGVFDRRQIAAVYQGTSKFNIEDYPSWSELL